MADVFISYSSTDRQIADRFVEEIEQHNIKCGIAPRNLTNAYSYQEEISNAIASTKVMVVLLTSAVRESECCLKELEFATDLNKAILPVFLEPIELPNKFTYYFLNKQAFHLYHDYAQGFQWFLAALKDTLNSRKTSTTIEESIIFPSTIKECTISNKQESKVFISYSTMDAKQVNKFVSTLEIQHVPCWIAPRDIPFGSNYAREINTAIENCRCILVFVSKQSQSSEEIEKEIQIATTYRKSIIPIRLENCDFTGPYMYHLKHKQWFNAYANGRDNINKLISNINDMPSSTSSTENENKHKEAEKMNLKEWLSDFMDSLLIIFDIILRFCLAIAKTVVCVIGITTCLAILYMLATGKSFEINIKDLYGMIQSFVH